MHPENLIPGKLVTVIKGPEVAQLSQTGAMIGHGENQACNGAVLRVLALSLPYVAVEVLWSHSVKTGVRMTLDVREIRFVEITEEYAQALTSTNAEDESEPPPMVPPARFLRREPSTDRGRHPKQE